MNPMLSNAQHWVGSYHEIIFESEIFLVINQDFVQALDSFVLKSQCVTERKEDTYFVMFFLRIGEGRYEIKLEQYQLPIGENSLGYFEIENFSFFIHGDIPDDLFIKSKNSQKFSYSRGILCVVEEFPVWGFSYQNSILFLKGHYCF